MLVTLASLVIVTNGRYLTPLRRIMGVLVSQPRQISLLHVLHRLMCLQSAPELENGALQTQQARRLFCRMRSPALLQCPNPLFIPNFTFRCLIAVLCVRYSR